MKKIGILILSALLCFSVLQFSVYSHWADGTADWFVENGYLTADGSMLTNLDMSAIRGQLALITVSLRGGEAGDTVQFSDIEKDDLYYDACLVAKAKGYIAGYEDGSFKPFETITREDACAILGRAFEISGSNEKTSFSDSGDIAGYARAYVGGMVESGIISGFPDGSFKPDDELTVGELLTISRLAYEKTEKNEQEVVTPPTQSEKTEKPSKNPGGVRVKSSEKNNSSAEPKPESVAPEFELEKYQPLVTCDECEDCNGYRMRDENGNYVWEEGFECPEGEGYYCYCGENNQLQPTVLTIDAAESDYETEYYIVRMPGDMDGTEEENFDLLKADAEKIDGTEYSTFKNGRYLVCGENSTGGRTIKSIDVTERIVMRLNPPEPYFEEYLSEKDKPFFRPEKDMDSEYVTVRLNEYAEFFNEDSIDYKHMDHYAYIGEKVLFDEVEPVFLNEAIEAETAKAEKVLAWQFQVKNGVYNYYIRDKYGNWGVRELVVDEPDIKCLLNIRPRESENEPVFITAEPTGDVVSLECRIATYISVNWDRHHRSYWDYYDVNTNTKSIISGEEIKFNENNEIVLTRNGIYMFIATDSQGRKVYHVLDLRKITEPEITEASVEITEAGDYKITIDVKENPEAKPAYIKYGVELLGELSWGRAGGGYIFDWWDYFWYESSEKLITLPSAETREFIVDMEKLRELNPKHKLNYIYIYFEDEFKNVGKIKVELLEK